MITQTPAAKLIMIHVTSLNWVTEVGSSQLCFVITKREPTVFLLSGLFVIISTALLLRLPMMLWLFFASLSLAPWNQIWTLSWQAGLKTKLYKITLVPSCSLMTKKQPWHSFSADLYKETQKTFYTFIQNTKKQTINSKI